MSELKVLVGCATKDKYGYLQHSLPHNMKLSGYENADWHIVNDGSTDETKEYLERLTKNPRVTITNFKQSKGISFCKNYFFSRAARLNYDYLCLIDDDILLSYNWLVFLSRTIIVNIDFGIIAPFVVNDSTMLRNIWNGGTELESTPDIDHCIFQVTGLGGACTLIRPDVFTKIKYNIDMESYTFADANYHGRVQNAGWKIGVTPLVSATHLPWIVMLDQEQEFKKLKIRHDVRKLPEASFEESKRKMLNRTLNPYIKGLCKCSR